MHTSLATISASTPATISGALRATTARSSDMPTARKNRPEKAAERFGRRPRAGCGRLIRTARRPGTPLIAIDRPLTCISRGRPEHDQERGGRRQYFAARLRGGEDAEQRDSAARARRRRGWPAEAMPVPMLVQRDCPVSVGSGDRKATSASSSGTISRSSNSRIDTIFWLRGRAQVAALAEQLHHDRGVEVMTNPIAPDQGRGPAAGSRRRGRHRSGARGRRSAGVPSPKISRRRFQRCEGCIQADDEQWNITTPSSATCRIAAGSENHCSPERADQRPAAR